MKMNRIPLVLLQPFALSLSATGVSGADALAKDYDSLQVDSGDTISIKEIAVNDSSRDREIPLRVYLPAFATRILQRASGHIHYDHGLLTSLDY